MTPRTVVAGAGVAGLSVAWELVQRGHQVTVVDRGIAGAESSWAGGGILSPLLPWNYGEAVSSLALRAMRAYPTWISGIEVAGQADAAYWPCGMLAFDVEDAERAAAWCAGHALPFLPGDRASVAGAGRGSVWLPTVAQIRNPRLIAALRAAILKQGGVLREQCPAVGVEIEGRRVTAVQTATGKLPADHVVVATGAWAGLGLPGLAGAPNVRPIRGQMLLFRLAPGALETILYRDGLYVIPRRDGHVLVGSTIEDVGFDKSTVDITLQRLHREAALLLPTLAAATPIRQWAGLRPGSPDNIPIIDRQPGLENVVVNVGHYRYGVTMAPAAAELVAGLLDGAPPAVDPAPYRWDAAQARRWDDTPASGSSDA